LMKAASIDGPSGLLAACPIFNIEILYCEFDFWANKMLACLLSLLRFLSLPFPLLLPYWEVNSAWPSRRE